MPCNEFTHRERTVQVRLDATASRRPGRSTPWTVEAGSWRADATTEKAAADALAAGLHRFLARYEPARLLTFRGRAAVVQLDLAADGSLSWSHRVADPDGRTTTTVLAAADWAAAEACTRSALAHRTTDWHDDASVHAAAAYLDRGPRGGDQDAADELYRYAAWQRAAHAAIEAGRTDWHAWASAHQREFAVRRPETGAVSGCARSAEATPVADGSDPRPQQQRTRQDLAQAGLVAMFTAEETECLVRTAGEAVCGGTDDLSARQTELARRAFHLANGPGRESAEPESPLHRLLELAEELGLDMLDLYDPVHDLASTAASDVNNAGVDAQVRYLLKELGEAGAEQEIRAAAPQRPSIDKRLGRFGC